MPHNSLRILFADDEKTLQDVMRSELPRLGHEVTVCADGRAALKVLEKNTFDAAILDLHMPGLTGIEVLEHLKGVSPDTEAIIMTGHASQETAIQSISTGSRMALARSAMIMTAPLSTPTSSRSRPA